MMKQTAIQVLMADGSTYQVRQLLSSKNAKIEKSNAAGSGFYTVGLSLAPSNLSGYNVCQRATEGCKAGCLFYAGKGSFQNVQRARIAKARAVFQNRDAFGAMLTAELTELRDVARAKGLTLAVRLNVLSDLPWERLMPELFTTFSDVQFYDYTKVPGRVVPSNYHLTFSRSEVNEQDALKEFRAGKNVAVVFSGKDIPATWHKVPVHSGDTTDLRFMDKRGIIGLYAKGTARGDRSGFVVALTPVSA